MAAVDRWANVETYPGNTLGPLLGPAGHAAAVTPSDSVELSYISRAIYVGVGGNVAVVMFDGSTVTLVGVVAGTMLPLRVRQVKATGTTATSIISFD